MAEGIDTTNKITFPVLLDLCGETLGALRRREMAPKESAQIFGGVRASVQVINAQARLLAMAGRSPDGMLENLSPETPLPPKKVVPSERT